jgi:hypothetical protein
MPSFAGHLLSLWTNHRPITLLGVQLSDCAREEYNLLPKAPRFQKERCVWKVPSKLLPSVLPVTAIYRLINDYGTLVEWYWQGKTEVLREKPVPVPLCAAQILRGLTWDRMRASAVGDRLSHGTVWLCHVVLHEFETFSTYRAMNRHRLGYTQQISTHCTEN